MLLSACATTATSPPDTVNPTLSTAAVPPTAGFVSWRLPKTVIDATVTFKYKDCKQPVNGRPVLELERSVALVAKGVPDDNIYGDYPGVDPMVRVPISALTSFWDDRSLSVERAANGTVSKLGATVEDQTAGIIGNVLTSAVKISSIAFGVAPGGAPAADVARCSAYPRTIKAEMERVNKLLRDPKTSQAAAQAYNLQLGDLQKKLDKLTITVTRTIDPGLSTPVPPASCAVIPAPQGCPGGPPVSVPANGLIATIVPSAKQLQEAKWLEGPEAAQSTAVFRAAISLFLDFARASPPIIATCPPPPTLCQHSRTVIDRTTLFRDVAYIPLIVVSGTDPTNRSEEFELTVNGARTAGALPFAQFGIPRRLPIDAGLFEKVTWSYSFNEFGEPTAASFGSAARGTKASTVLAGAAGAAATFAAQERANAALPDADTAAMQAETAKLKARIDLAKARQEAADLESKGLLPE
ncbi:MAG TPA: hypothetical protein VEB39_06700 [Sphingomicrobium sp.]|nr:hypothetical protein [Sphingomicrobium sp.]